MDGDAKRCEAQTENIEDETCFQDDIENLDVQQSENNNFEGTKTCNDEGITALKWYQKAKQRTSRPFKLKRERNRSLIDGGYWDNEHWGSMEALGLYGLLTPAVAALPVSEEFDTIHKQVREQLGVNWELKLAAAHVDDALKGRGKYGKARSYFKTKMAQRCFKVLENTWYQRIFLVTILIHSLVILFEPPSVEVKAVHAVIYVANAICIPLYIFDLMIRIRFLSWSVFWSFETEERYWNGFQFVLVCLFLVDLIILCVSSILNMYIPQPFRCLRPVMLLCRVKSIRHIFEVLTIIGTNLLKVLFIILIFIITFASIGVHLFMTTYNTKYSETANATQSNKCCVDIAGSEAIYVGAFDHLGTAMLRLFVLLSTENYPEIMLPALRKHKLNFFFFGVFVFFGVFFLTAILLAIVVDSYWIFAKRTVKKERAIERTELAKAWNLLDPMGLGALPVTDQQFTELFKILKPKNTDEQNVMLIHLLDSQSDGDIDSFEWTTSLRQVLNAEFEDVSTEEKNQTSKVFARIRKNAKNIIESPAFSRVMLCLILFHGLLFCLKWKGQPSKCELGIHGLRLAVTVIFVFEVAIRIVGLGRDIMNILELTDVALVVIAVTFNSLWYINVTGWIFKEVCVIISSVAVIIRWLLSSSGTRKAFRWFLNIVPVMFDLVVLLFVILYLLSTVAMELFFSYGTPTKDQIYPDYCGLGFKNFWCSFLVMFQTLTTSNWHEIMNLANSQTKSNVAYFFFPLSYLIITMIVMNLFVAIAIEAANKLTASDPMSPQHRTTEQEMQKQPKGFNEGAKKILHAMAKNFFGSARVDDVQDRNQRQQINASNSSLTITLTGKSNGNSTIILSSPKRSATKDNDEQKKDDEVEEIDSDNEDYSGLSPKAKRERQLKNRMKKKKKARQKNRKTSANVLDQIQKQVRAIASFRGTQPTDLDLVVGDTITVVATRDEWMQGECEGVTGWFPASHVVNWTVKTLQESRKHSAKNKAENVNIANINDQASIQIDNPNDLQTQYKNAATEESLQEAKQNSNVSNSLLSPQPGYRIKMKKSNDWRREILGDMTVMNAEEMRELNKVMRADLRRAPTSRSSKSNSISRKPGSPSHQRRQIAPTIEEQFDDEATDSLYNLRESTDESLRRPRTDTNGSNEVFRSDNSPNMNSPKIATHNKIRPSTPSRLLDDKIVSKEKYPTVSVSQMSTLEFSANVDAHEAEIATSKEDSSNKHFLGINVAEEKRKKTKKDATGEIPEWAKKFAEAKNINFQTDVKFTDPVPEDIEIPGFVDTKK